MSDRILPPPQTITFPDGTTRTFYRNYDGEFISETEYLILKAQSEEARKATPPPPPPPAPDPLRAALSRLVDRLTDTTLPSAGQLLIERFIPKPEPVILTQLSDADRIQYLQNIASDRELRIELQKYLDESRKAKQPPCLAGLNLYGRDLSQLDLSGVDLSHAKLKNCKLVGANLKQENLCDAVLSESDFTKRISATANSSKWYFAGVSHGKPN